MALFSRIIDTFAPQKPVDWDELEEILVSADLGPHLSMRLIDQLQAKGGAVDGETIVEHCRAEILQLLPEQPPVHLDSSAKGYPGAVLIVGVNGTGKTTSTAKLAKFLKDRRFSVVLAAADTFRAAAIEQLEIWANRIDVPLVKGAYKSDPSSVCFDAWQLANREKADFLLCDSAGRLHTRHNLMAELDKIRRTLGKTDSSAPHETLLVIDASTGGNAIQQAREFHKATPLTGLIVTKLDGSGRGGCIVAIQDELGIPTRFIGTGEKVDDFDAFDRQRFVEELL